jgi:hypothetical protein
MSALEPRLLLLIASLIVAYVAVIGTGYLLTDEEEWRHRRQIAKAQRLAEPGPVTAAPAEASPVQPQSRHFQSTLRWIRDTHWRHPVRRSRQLNHR